MNNVYCWNPHLALEYHGMTMTEMWELIGELNKRIPNRLAKDMLDGARDGTAFAKVLTDALGDK